MAFCWARFGSSGRGTPTVPYGGTLRRLLLGLFQAGQFPLRLELKRRHLILGNDLLKAAPGRVGLPFVLLNPSLRKERDRDGVAVRESGQDLLIIRQCLVDLSSGFRILAKAQPGARKQ